MAKNTKVPEDTEKLPSGSFLPQLGRQPTAKPQAAPTPADEDLSLPSLSRSKNATQTNTSDSTFLPGIGQPNSRSPQQEESKRTEFPPIGQSRNTAQTNTSSSTSLPGLGRMQSNPAPIRGNIISLARIRGAPTQPILSNPDSFKTPSFDPAIKNSPPTGASNFSLPRDPSPTAAADGRGAERIKNEQGTPVPLTNKDKGAQDFPEYSPPVKKLKTPKVKKPKVAFDELPETEAVNNPSLPVQPINKGQKDFPDPDLITTPQPVFDASSVKDPLHRPPAAKTPGIPVEYIEEDIPEDFEDAPPVKDPLHGLPIAETPRISEIDDNDNPYALDKFEEEFEEKSDNVAPDSPTIVLSGGGNASSNSQEQKIESDPQIQRYERPIAKTESFNATETPGKDPLSPPPQLAEKENPALSSPLQNPSLAAQASLVKEFSAFLPKTQDRQGLPGILQHLENQAEYGRDPRKLIEDAGKLNPSLEELNRYKSALEHMYKEASLLQELRPQVEQALTILKPLDVLNKHLAAIKIDGEYIKISAEVASVNGDPKAKSIHDGAFESYLKDKRIEVDLVALPKEINPRVIFAELAAQEGFIFQPKNQTLEQKQSEEKKPTDSPAKQVFQDFQLSPFARQNFDANAFATYLQQQTYEKSEFAQQYGAQVRTLGSYKELATAFFTAYQAATQTQKDGFSLPSKAVIDEAKDHIEKIRSLIPDKDKATADILISRSSDKSYTEALVKYCEVQGYRYNDTSGYNIFKNEQEKRLYPKSPEAQIFKELANAPRGSNKQEAAQEAVLESSNENESAPSRLKL